MLPWLLLLLLVMSTRPGQVSYCCLSRDPPRLSAPRRPWSSRWVGITCILRQKGPEETGAPPGCLAQGFSS